MITEIFSSIQGEGIYVGQPQIFIRFAKCNLNCDYCDTPRRPGKKYGLYDILDEISRLDASGTIRTVSVTGGEPLLYTAILKTLLPEIKKRHFDVHLETNGVLSSALAEVLDFVDVIAMDIKLPSAQKRNKSFWTRHRNFLMLAAGRKKNIFVKIVITDKTTAEEIKKAVTIIYDVDPKIPVVLQPVTPANRTRKKIPRGRAEEFQRLAKTVLTDVRVIPQVHKVLGVK